MQAVILIGIQGSGKSTFCKQRFYDTHVRINLDMLRTRHRERKLVAACIAAGQPFVIDNTNPTVKERGVYILSARSVGFRTIGYYFASRLQDCARRNESRPPQQIVPLKGLLGTYGRLQTPSREEGFDELHYVSIDEHNNFTVGDWTYDV